MSRRIVVLTGVVVVLGGTWFLSRNVSTQEELEAPPRSSRSIPSGRNHYPTTGCWGRRLACQWIVRTTCGSSIGDRLRFTPTNARSSSRRRPVSTAARRRHRCLNSTPRAIWSAPGADRARGTSGPPRTMASRSITTTTSGSAATVLPTRTSSSSAARASS